MKRGIDDVYNTDGAAAVAAARYERDHGGSGEGGDDSDVEEIPTSIGRAAQVYSESERLIVRDESEVDIDLSEYIYEKYYNSIFELVDLFDCIHVLKEREKKSEKIEEAGKLLRKIIEETVVYCKVAQGVSYTYINLEAMIRRLTDDVPCELESEDIENITKEVCSNWTSFVAGEAAAHIEVSYYRQNSYFNCITMRTGKGIYEVESIAKTESVTSSSYSAAAAAAGAVSAHQYIKPTDSLRASTSMPANAVLDSQQQPQHVPVDWVAINTERVFGKTHGLQAGPSHSPSGAPFYAASIRAAGQDRGDIIVNGSSFVMIQ